MYKTLRAPLLRNLRRMMPRFSMDYPHALRVAERQAVRLARHFAVDTRVISETDLTSITDIVVRRDCLHRQCPISGHCFYDRGHWVIVLDEHEPVARQRFTIAHELKHIIDAGCALEHIYAALSASEVEHVCDHFAACLLMSKQAVYHLWGEGLRTPEALAMACHVSVSAMKRRMKELALPLDIEAPPVIALRYTDAFPDTDEPDTLQPHFIADTTPGAPS